MVEKPLPGFRLVELSSDLIYFSINAVDLQKCLKWKNLIALN